MSYEIEYYAVSHIGKCRKVNQDNLVCDGQYLNCENNGTEGILRGKVSAEETKLFGIFDGMGGEECGEVAAYLAAQTAARLTFTGEVERELSEYCQKVNRKICRYIKKKGLSSMGTTAAMLLFGRKRITLCNIGDSKVYLLSKNCLQQISYDHVSVAPAGQKPPLTQNLGIPEEELVISPYFATGEYQKGNIYLICSDGLTDMVETAQIAEILQGSDREAAIKQLLQEALDNGGKDNVSFVVLYIEKKLKLLHLGKGKKDGSR